MNNTSVHAKVYGKLREELETKLQAGVLSMCPEAMLPMIALGRFNDREDVVRVASGIKATVDSNDEYTPAEVYFAEVIIKDDNTLDVAFCKGLTDELVPRDKGTYLYPNNDCLLLVEHMLKFFIEGGLPLSN